MKILIFILFYTALTTITHAQNIFPVDGNVGIGTTIPEERLTVLMDPATNGGGIAVKAVNNGGAGSQPGYAYLNSSGSKRMYNFLDIHTDTYNVANAQGSNLLTINQSGNVGIGTVTPGIWFPGKVLEIKGTYNQLLTIKGNGNIGMGTETPSEKLSVNGNIRAKEIKVEATGWPDYVFIKSYQLPTLQETEKHIKEKGHLPGIPSAAEVKANGIDLGEMNAKLLQKIEELTLHLIEMRKELDELKKK